MATEKFDLAAAYKVAGGTSTGQNASGGGDRNCKHIHVLPFWVVQSKQLHESDKERQIGPNQSTGKIQVYSNVIAQIS